MFTGIVAGLGQVVKTEDTQHGRKLALCTSFSLSQVKLGDSIAVNGCCLTVTTRKARSFTADISPETLRLTNLGELKVGERVNLELPLRIGDPLGGHLVQGHVDGLAKIIHMEEICDEREAYWRVGIRLPAALAKYVVEKGSIAVDGISLTVNRLRKNDIELCIIPHTQSRTVLTSKNVGDKVNIEVDMMLKYLATLAQRSMKNYVAT